MPWFFNTISGELANESGIAALPYKVIPSWHQLKVPGTDTFAEAAADAAKEFPASPPATGSTTAGLSQVPAGAAATATGVNYSSIENALTGFYDVVTNGKMWRSLGWLLLGVALMFIGLWLWIGPSVVTQDPVSLARKGLGI